MKRFFPILCCIFFFSFTALSQTKEGNAAFVITGQIEGAKDQSLSLFNMENNSETKSTLKDGNFHITEEIEKNLVIFALKLEESDVPIFLVLGKADSLNIQSSVNEFPIATVEGNQQSIEMQQYQKGFFPIIKKAQALNQKAAALQNKNDTAAIQNLKKASEQLQKEMVNTSLAFVQYHKESLASVVALSRIVKAIPPQQFKQLFNTLSAEVQHSTIGESIIASINSELATYGKEAPDFTLNDSEGKPVSLSSFKGKYVLIDFWASWCGPCRRENPNVVKAYNRYKDQNFTILGVSLDTKEKRWKQAIAQDHLDWTQVSDLKGWNNAAARLYHVNGIPANFLLDPSGKIIGKNLRGAALVNKLAELFD